MKRRTCKEEESGEWMEWRLIMLIELVIIIIYITSPLSGF